MKSQKSLGLHVWFDFEWAEKIFLWGSAHKTKLSDTCLVSYLCAEKSFVTIPCLERILSHQTCKPSDFWDFIPLGNPVLKSEKALKCAKNDGFEMKFSIDVSLKNFGGIQYHQYGYVKHCWSPGLYARKKILPIGHSNQKILMKTLTPSRKNPVQNDFPSDHCKVFPFFQVNHG